MPPKIDLKIDEVVIDKTLKHPDVAHPWLPQHEFSMLIVAPKGSGKTNFVCNMLLKHYKGYFNKVLVCSPTVDNDEKWDVVKETKNILKENKQLGKIMDGHVTQRKIPVVVHKSTMDMQRNKEKFDGIIPEESFFSDMNLIPEKIKIFQDTIAKLKPDLGKKAKYKADRVLLIMDDQAGLFRSGTNNPIVNYVLKHRHYSSSLIIVTQAYKAIPKTIRNNMSSLILFECPNEKEIEGVYEEWTERMNYEEWTSVYEYATAEPYAFLYINSKFNRNERVFKNFEQQLAITTIRDRKTYGDDQSTSDDDESDTSSIPEKEKKTK